MTPRQAFMQGECGVLGVMCGAGGAPHEAIGYYASYEKDPEYSFVIAWERESRCAAGFVFDSEGEVVAALLTEKPEVRGIVK